MMIKRGFTSLCYNNIKQIAPSFANNVVHTLFPVKSNKYAISHYYSYSYDSDKYFEFSMTK